VGREEVGLKVWEGGECELFFGGGSTSATSVLRRRRYPLTVRGYLFTLNVRGLAVFLILFHLFYIYLIIVTFLLKGIRQVKVSFR